MKTDAQIEKLAKKYELELDKDKTLDKAWYDYRCKYPNTVSGYMEKLPSFVRRWKKKKK